MTAEMGFRFDYTPPIIRYGAGCVGDLGSEIHELNCSRALVVSGRTTGATPAVMDPVKRGLGDRLAGEFTETAPEKRLQTAVDCANRLEAADADVLVAVGGGSSIDVARVAGVVAAGSWTPEELGSQLAATATLPIPDDLTPVVAVPTTLAGAGLSMLAGVSARPESGLVEEPVGGGIGDPQLMSALALYDPELIAETPEELLVGSAINGFSKGVEALYSSTRTPITDATAARGLGFLFEGLSAMGADPDVDDLDPIIRGLILAQYGTTRPSGTMFSVLHATGHALRVHTGVQLGVAHAAVAPDALAWIFEETDGRRRLLADALDVAEFAPAETAVADSDDSAALATEVVAAVREFRDGLGLPARLRDIDAVDYEDLDAVAMTAADGFLGANDAPSSDGAQREARATAHGWSGTPHTPPGLEVTRAAVRDVLKSAW